MAIKGHKTKSMSTVIKWYGKERSKIRMTVINKNCILYIFIFLIIFVIFSKMYNPSLANSIVVIILVLIKLFWTARMTKNPGLEGSNPLIFWIIISFIDNNIKTINLNGVNK